MRQGEGHPPKIRHISWATLAGHISNVLFQSQIRMDEVDYVYHKIKGVDSATHPEAEPAGARAQLVQLLLAPVHRPVATLVTAAVVPAVAGRRALAGRGEAISGVQFVEEHLHELPMQLLQALVAAPLPIDGPHSVASA